MDAVTICPVAPSIRRPRKHSDMQKNYTILGVRQTFRAVPRKPVFGRPCIG